jgi:hypothetical protein
MGPTALLQPIVNKWPDVILNHVGELVGATFVWTTARGGRGQVMDSSRIQEQL